MAKRVLIIDNDPMTVDMTPEISGFDLRNLSRDFFDNPYPTYAALQSNAPLHRLPDGSILLTRHADLVSVYKAPHTFSSDKRVEFAPKFEAAPLLLEHHTTSLVFNDPPLHSQVRKTLMGAMHRRAIEVMEEPLQALVDGLLDKIEAAGGGDLIEDYAAAIPIEVIGNLLNIPSTDRAPLRGWSMAILGGLEPKLSSEQLAIGNQAVHDFLGYLKGLVADRRKRPGNPDTDVLTRLIQSGALTEVELLHNCIFLLNAGHETTTNLIGNALVALTQYPEQRAALQALLDKPSGLGSPASLMDSSVDEFLRFESSNQLGNRRAVKDCVVGGGSFKVGTLFTLCIAAANRDPVVFVNPQQLNVFRTEAEGAGKHLAFGFGIHQCAGLHLARLEGRVALAGFLKRFPNYCLTNAPMRSQRVRFRGFVRVGFAIT